MSIVHSPKSNLPDIPDDVVMRFPGVSKKFCRNLRRSMWYGIQDLSRNLVGFRSSPGTLDIRPWTGGKTLDIRHETLDSGEGGGGKTLDSRHWTLDQGTGGEASAQSLKSNVYSPKSSQNSATSPSI